MPVFGFSRPRNLHQAFASCWRGLCVFALCLACAFASGCVNLGSLPKRQPPSSPRQAPLDAYALSEGKITRFIPMPELLDNPADKGMLLACRQLPIASHTARSAVLAIKTGQFGNGLLNALVVGPKILILPGDVARIGMSFGGSERTFTLYPNSAQAITLFAGTRHATVGKINVRLKSPVIATQTHDLVMEWADMLALLKERDRQRHQPPFIRSVQVFYTMREYENSVPPFGKP